MSLKLRLFVCLLLFFTITESKAQDPVFTQFMLVPETINPAFTGIANAWNAGILNRRQWPDGNRRMDTRYGYVNNMVTDQLAVGGTVLNHQEEFTNYNYLQLNAAVSYRVELDYDWRLRFGLEGGYGRKNFNFSNLLLEDQININDGSINNGSIDPGVLHNGDKIDFWDFSAGVVVDKEDMWFGAALKHINRPDIAFTERGNVPLDMFLTVHGGYYLILDNTPLSFMPDDSDVMFTFNYMRQSQYNRLDLGGVVEMPMFSFGLIAATNPQGKSDNSHFITSINSVISMKLGEFTFGYSYDFNTSQIGHTQGVYELSLTWQSDHTCNRCDNYKVRLKRNGEAGYTH
jgi:type IX secretion system PorP/SprF family membrane protein